MDRVDVIAGGVRWVVAAILIGCVVGFIERFNAVRDYQDAAVERGYAEWVPPEDPRGKQVWQWIEPE